MVYVVDYKPNFLFNITFFFCVCYRDIKLLLLFRDHHVKNIYSPMVNIMALVLEESEEIAVDMIKPLLASINNSEVLAKVIVVCNLIMFIISFFVID